MFFPKFVIVLLIGFLTISLTQATRTCDPEIPCNIAIDVVLVLDESSSISPPSFLALKNFAKDFVGLFTISPSDVHVGCVMFSTLSRTVLDLAAPGAANAVVVQNSLSAIIQVPGQTNTQSGIARARTMLTTARGTRTVNKQIMVIVTDGNANLPSPIATAKQQAINQATGAKGEGVLVFGIAVGSNIDLPFISSLSSGSQYTFSVNNFPDLQTIIQDLLDKSCYQPPVITISNTEISCDESILPSNTGVPQVTGWCHGCHPPPPTFNDTILRGLCSHSKTIQRTWTVADKCGTVKKVVQLIKVTDSSPPVFKNFPPDTQVECNKDTSTSALGSPGAVDNCDPKPSVTYLDVKVPGSCPNDYTIFRTWKTRDACGNTAQKVQKIEVRDSTPPVVSKINDFCLWPPNHKYYCIKNLTISDIVDASDECSDDTYVKFLGCTSNQADNDNGDGNTVQDCTYDKVTDTLCIRSERAGNKKEDRVYTVNLLIVDSIKPRCIPNKLQVNLEVRVPHDQRNHPDCRAPNTK